MKNVIILLADFYPNPSPNTICFLPYIEALAKTCHVDLVTSDTGKWEGFTLENTEVYRIKDRKMMNHFKWLNRIENAQSPIKKRLLRYCSYGSKLIKEMQYYDPSIERVYRGWRKQEVMKVLNELSASKTIDAVISISHPFYTHRMVYELKKQYDFTWYLLEYDAYGINDFLFKKEKAAQRIAEEKQCFACADKILLTPQLYDAYLENEYAMYADKFFKLEFCNFYRPPIHVETVEHLLAKDKISLFYAGAFNLYIRNPKQVFEFLSLSKESFQLTVVTKCILNYVEQEIQKLNDKIRIFPRKSFDTVYYNELQTNILVSIGNAIRYQSPGKTLELLSTGRPIIHFCFIDNDPVLPYLEHYDEKLIVYLNRDLDEQIDAFDAFLRKKHRYYRYEEVLLSNPNYDPSRLKRAFTDLFAKEGECDQE